MKLYLYKGKINDRTVNFGENKTRKIWKHVCLKIKCHNILRWVIWQLDNIWTREVHINLSKITILFHLSSPLWFYHFKILYFIPTILCFCSSLNTPSPLPPPVTALAPSPHPDPWSGKAFIVLNSSTTWNNMGKTSITPLPLLLVKYSPVPVRFRAHE